MFFFPYAPDEHLPRFPTATLVVCLGCLLVTFLQQHNEAQLDEVISGFCAEKPPHMYRLAMSRTADPRGRSCSDLMSELSWSDDRDAVIIEIAESARFQVLSLEAGQTEVEKQLRQRFAVLEQRLPEPLTPALWHMSDTWDPWRMLTSTFAHADWQHVAGNVYFFFAFGAAVEAVIGVVGLVFTFLLVAFGTGIAYTIAMAGEPAIPTLGLSGVVSGMMGALFILSPHLNLRCVLWLVVWFKRFSVPAWLLFAWYFGWDAYYLWTPEDEWPDTNLVAHVAGGVLGCGAALSFRYVLGLRQESVVGERIGVGHR